MNFDIWFSKSIDMTQKKFVFSQLSRYIVLVEFNSSFKTST